MLIGCGQIPQDDNSTIDGAGFRTWQLYNGLQSAGFDVDLIMYSYDGMKLHKDRCLIKDSNINFDETTTQEEIILKMNPDVVVYYYWPIIQLKNRSRINNVPICIDFAGPVLVEKNYQTNGIDPFLIMEKFKRLNYADFYTCSGNRQYYYFAALLLCAGIHDIIDKEILKVVPLSIDPKIPKIDYDAKSKEPITFIHSGYFHPWQNPFPGLEPVGYYARNNKRCVLDIFGCPGNESKDETRRIKSKIGISEQIHYLGIKSYNEIMDACKTGSIAIDVMEQNLERELGMNIRSLQHLWCGLPIIYNNYNELSQYIEKYKAGWCVDPKDKEGISNLIEDIINHPEIIPEYSKNSGIYIETAIKPTPAFEELKIKLS